MIFYVVNLEGIANPELIGKQLTKEYDSKELNKIGKTSDYLIVCVDKSLGRYVCRHWFTYDSDWVQEKLRSAGLWEEFQVITLPELLELLNNGIRGIV